MTEKLRWPNVEKAVVTYLAQELTAPVFTRTASDTAEKHDKFAVLERSGGSGLWIFKDVDISIAVTARTREAMWDLAADVETAFDALAAGYAGDVYVDDVEEAFGFAFDPAENSDLRRASAIFSLTVRPTRA